MPKLLEKINELDSKSSPQNVFSQNVFSFLINGIRDEIRSLVREIATEEVVKSLTQLRGPIGPKGDKGDKPKFGIDYPTPKEIDYVLTEITPVKGVHYFDGVEGKQGPRGLQGEKGKDADPQAVVPLVVPEVMKRIPKQGTVILDSGEQIVGKINKLPTQPEFQIDASHIKNIQRIAASYKKRLGRGTGSPVQVHDLSSSLNGVTKTFTIPLNCRVLLVVNSSTPFVFRPTVDFTTTSTTITFSTEVDASNMLAAGQSLLVLYVEQ
jgi:hypothetical protein